MPTDKELRSQALALMHDIYKWSKVYDLSEQARTPETKRFIKNIAVRMYRREEALCCGEN